MLRVIGDLAGALYQLNKALLERLNKVDLPLLKLNHDKNLDLQWLKI